MHKYENRNRRRSASRKGRQTKVTYAQKSLCVSFLELNPMVAKFAPTLYSCCFLYRDAVGYVTKPVHCLTHSRSGRADSDFGRRKASKQNYIRVSIQKRTEM